MTANEYKPVSWNGEAITNNKLNQMANNTQFLFERAPRIRYQVAGLTKDTGIKVLAGKTQYPNNGGIDYIDVTVQFGSYFTAGCKPIVTAVCSESAYGLRKFVMTRGLSNRQELDHTGFIGHVTAHEPPGFPADRYIGGGWMHWIAVGY